MEVEEENCLEVLLQPFLSSRGTQPGLRSTVWEGPAQAGGEKSYLSCVSLLSKGEDLLVTGEDKRSSSLFC